MFIVMAISYIILQKNQAKTADFQSEIVLQKVLCSGIMC